MPRERRGHRASARAERRGEPLVERRGALAIDAARGQLLLPRAHAQRRGLLRSRQTIAAAVASDCDADRPATRDSTAPRRERFELGDRSPRARRRVRRARCRGAARSARRSDRRRRGTAARALPTGSSSPGRSSSTRPAALDLVGRRRPSRSTRRAPRPSRMSASFFARFVGPDGLALGEIGVAAREEPIAGDAEALPDRSFPGRG